MNALGGAANVLVSVDLSFTIYPFADHWIQTNFAAQMRRASASEDEKKYDEGSFDSDDDTPSSRKSSQFVSILHGRSKNSSRYSIT